MIKLLLVALVLRVACADTISGDWKTVAIAADNVDKIEEGGPKRLYLRHLQCQAECEELVVSFQVKQNEYCTLTNATAHHVGDGVYRLQYSGDDHFKVVKQTEDFIVFDSVNIDTASRKTNLIFILGKGKALDDDQVKELEECSATKHIPKENIRYLQASDTCP